MCVCVYIYGYICISGSACFSAQTEVQRVIQIFSEPLYLLIMISKNTCLVLYYVHFSFNVSFL